MRIDHLETHVLKLPLERPIAAAVTGGAKLAHVRMLVVRVVPDDGPTGLGFAFFLQGSPRAFRAVVEDDLAPLLAGEDPLDHERLWVKMYRALQSVGRHGLVIQAQSAIDVALWDLKAKAAGMPLFKLLGGLRDRCPAYGSDCGWLWMTTDEIARTSAEYVQRGFCGVKMKVGHDDARTDLARVREVRRLLGDDVWLAVDANQKWDYPTALRMGREFEQLGCAWFEEPMTCEDPAGHARLCEKLDIPIALGETLGSRHEIAAYLRAGAVDIVQPDVTRVGGITEWLKIAALCAAYHRPVEPHLMMEVSVHFACALPGVAGVEYMPWLTPAFAQPPRMEDGMMVPPSLPGLGLELDAAALSKPEG